MWQQVKQLVGLSKPPTKRLASSATPCSELYDLVLDMDWTSVIRHCRDNPEDARFQEGDGLESPLYLACQWNPPVNAVKALIRANPDALLWTSREHRDLPLHMICRSPATSPELVREMLRTHPESACHATKYGKTALWVLCEYSQPDCMKASDNVSNRPFTLEQHEQIQAFWEKIEIVVEAVAKSRQHSWPARQETQQEDNVGMLYRVHGLVSLGALGCPIRVLEYICDKYPQQLRVRDESGQLPLHLAVGPTQWSPSGIRKYKPREQAIIQLLLRQYPEAALVRLHSMWDYYDKETGKRREDCSSSDKGAMDKEGRYPLHIALANRHTWKGGVQELFLAAPRVVAIKDPVTQLYPFQLAAIPIRENLAVDAGTIVELLRQRPDLIALCCAESRAAAETQNAAGDNHHGCASRSNETQPVEPVVDRGDELAISCRSARRYSSSTTSSLHLSRQEDESTMLFGLGVVAAVGAGLWYWKHAHTHYTDEATEVVASTS
ncbi:expressed unknown protein [Seminavis robusta]|uniref:Uncharacterized protein n=1 Tax=Seminavis robusta TaxID=568900 RepID=A0A9N8DLF4_9STRA|nr:expressed unknown protein [Seminavis robusta]|eukprot:Sro120_g058680.1 n/a (495) ;mRNA; f:99954-101438